MVPRPLSAADGAMPVRPTPAMMQVAPSVPFETERYIGMYVPFTPDVLMLFTLKTAEFVIEPRCVRFILPVLRSYDQRQSEKTWPWLWMPLLFCVLLSQSAIACS